MVILKPNGTSQKIRQVDTVRLNLYELEEYLAVEVFCPGVDRESVEIDVEGRLLTIAGKCPQHDATGRVLLREYEPGGFRRSLKLPKDVEASEAEASYDDGVLRISLPKARQHLRRKIAIN